MMNTRRVIYISLCTVIIFMLTACSEEHEIKSVKTTNTEKSKHWVVCPFCRKKSLLQNFKDAPEPNMSLCPKCHKRIPKPLLLRQTAVSKRH